MSGHAHDEAAAVRALAVVEQFVCLPFPLTAEERSEWMTAKGRALGAIEAARLTVDTPGQPSEQATADVGSDRWSAVASGTPLSLDALQRDQVPWIAHNFGERPAHVPLLGALEELGELAHAHIKGEQGIRHTPEEVAALKRDAIADIVIYLADYATSQAIDMQAAVEETWGRVRARDWRADPAAGVSGGTPPSVESLLDDEDYAVMSEEGKDLGGDGGPVAVGTAANLCCVCGVVSLQSTWTYWKLDDEGEDWVPVEPGDYDPMMLCPVCGWEHRDTDDGSGVYGGTLAEMEAQRAADAPEMAESWAYALAEVSRRPASPPSRAKARQWRRSWSPPETLRGTPTGSARLPEPDLLAAFGRAQYEADAEKVLARAETAERELAELRESLRPVPTDEGGPGKEEAYWLRAKLRGAVTHLRDVEDYYRVRGGLPLGFNMIRADRARDLYEAITEDFVNGKRGRPTRADLERSVGLLEEALRRLIGCFDEEWIAAHSFPETVKAFDAARCALAGVETGPGKDDTGDSGAVVAEDSGRSGASAKRYQVCPRCEGQEHDKGSCGLCQNTGILDHEGDPYLPPPGYDQGTPAEAVARLNHMVHAPRHRNG